MRLIDADALKERLAKCIDNRKAQVEQSTTEGQHEYHLGKMSGYVMASKIVDELPTIDPVKHGKWIGTWEKGAYTCSECRFIMDTPNDVTTNFCPNCGARMGL